MFREKLGEYLKSLFSRKFGKVKRVTKSFSLQLFLLSPLRSGEENKKSGMTEVFRSFLSFVLKFTNQIRIIILHLVEVETVQSLIIQLMQV